MDIFIIVLIIPHTYIINLHLSIMSEFIQYVICIYITN